MTECNIQPKSLVAQSIFALLYCYLSSNLVIYSPWQDWRWKRCSLPLSVLILGVSHWCENGNALMNVLWMVWVWKALQKKKITCESITICYSINNNQLVTKSFWPANQYYSCQEILGPKFFFLTIVSLQIAFSCAIAQCILGCGATEVDDWKKEAPIFSDLPFLERTKVLIRTEHGLKSLYSREGTL